RVLDEQSARDLIAEARAQVLERAGSGDSELAAAVAHIVTEASESRLHQILHAALGNDRRKLERFFSALPEGEDALRRLAERAHGVLDYNDLISETLALLKRGDTAAWVLYKLDGGLDHVLIDEAQDTSPEQWQIVRKLTEEFFAGAGRRDLFAAPRTVFAVGDQKQSIFSVQGADP